MDNIDDLELIKVRLRFIDLLKSFFAEEPDAEKMSRWRGTFSALDRQQISHGFDAAVRALAEHLGKADLHGLKDQYYALFVDPYSKHQVELTASYHLQGRSYDRPLVEIRTFMAEAGLEKRAGVVEPEDSLVVLLDLFGSLVERERGDQHGARRLQGRLIERFLEPLTVSLCAALDEYRDGRFYHLGGMLLRAYIDLEKGLRTDES